MKGFVGGIPIALLAVAAQAMDHMDNDYPGTGVGGTAMGGPSGADMDGGFNSLPVDVHTHTNVNEFSKDDHSITVKNKDVYPPPPMPIPYGVAMAPGMGPFVKAKPDTKPKRSWPHGGTAMGGPSGNDEGQVFDMPIVGNFYTNVDEESTDDHSIKLKDENVYPPAQPPIHPPISHSPAHPPVSHPPPEFVDSPGPPFGRPGFREAKQSAPEDYHIPAAAFEKRWAPEEGGTAIGGPGGGEGPFDGPAGGDGPFDGPVGGDGPFDGPAGFPYPIRAGGTAIGGPSGEDDGISFDNGIHANFHTNVNENYQDDHSIDLKHTDIYPLLPRWSSADLASVRGWEPEQGGTAMGGPSGNDGGQEFNMPIIVNTHTDVDESYKDDHSIDIKNKDVYPPPPAFPEFGGPGPVIPEGPFRRAYSPSSEKRTAGDGVGGGTAEGGPSGDDDGINFGTPDDVDVDSNVNEHHVDNHAIKADTTDVHLPEMPWMPHHAPHPEPEAPAPDLEPEAPAHAPHPEPEVVPAPEHEEAPACAPEIHNIVQTVTKTATQVVRETHTVHDVNTVTMAGADHVVQDTHTVYVTPSEHVVQVTDTVTAPAAHVVEATETVYVSPSHVVETVAMPTSHAESMPAVPYSSQIAQPGYSNSVQAPASSAYSMIPVQVPAATPSSSMATMIMPSDVDAMHSFTPSASATPSQGVMFTGDAARLSGGIVSAAAALMGVLAFIL
ncbi:uncharacterized protein N7498_006698 [Penicillium cinerascens]|uniref:GPI anchored protein n=1 Tax=Penicillium cinerascens TaxID=70096 RepID=A0A9W9MIP1_9EURO|nr:uncharacterized protein N7498_006698 [Penicillium cinerascens]KAJ5202035.1 hypothetical protein N7498_006698 [Penicillium cinerascens]